MKLPERFGDSPFLYDVLSVCSMVLSGGEKQRLSLVRAFLKDAPILVVR
ncbi:hypothetical protein [Lysinibacillus sp. NPDC056232]